MIELDVFNQASDALQVTFVQWADKYLAASGADLTETRIEIGKAMVMMGGTFLGQALGVKNATQGLQPALDCLAAYETLTGKSIGANLSPPPYPETNHTKHATEAKGDENAQSG